MDNLDDEQKEKLQRLTSLPAFKDLPNKIAVSLRVRARVLFTIAKWQPTAAAAAHSLLILLFACAVGRVRTLVEEQFTWNTNCYDLDWFDHHWSKRNPKGDNKNKKNKSWTITFYFLPKSIVLIVQFQRDDFNFEHF